MKKLPLTTLHLDYHLPELAKTCFAGFDRKGYLEVLKSQNTGMVVLFAKDHFGNAYYNTRYGNRHRDLPCDLLALALHKLKKCGCQVFAYYSLCWELKAPQAHPEYNQRYSDGRIFYENECWRTACVNSPYLEELVLPQLRELAANYPIDGIFIDIANYHSGSCYCQGCLEKFRKKYNRLPKAGGMPREFLADSMTDALRKIRRTISPLQLCVNSSWGLGTPPELDEITDFSVVESQPAHVSSGGYLLQMIQAKYCHAEGRPFQIITVRFNGGGWGELSLKSVAQLEFEFAMIAMHGGYISCGDQGDFDGMLQMSAHQTIQKAFSFLIRRQPWLGGRSRRRIAVIWPRQEQYPFSIPGLPPALPGAAKMLTELSQQYEFCSFEALKKNLSEYGMVMIPEGIEVLPEIEILLDKFVRAGGILYREPGPDVHHQDDSAHCYFEFGTEIILLKNPLYELKPCDGEIFIKAFPAVGTYNPKSFPWRSSFPPADNHQPAPGIVVSCRGKGKVFSSASGIFSAFWKTGDFRIRELMECLLQTAGIEPLFRFSRINLLGNLVDDEDGIQLHILHYNSRFEAGCGYPAIDVVEPVEFELEVIAEHEPESVTLQPDGIPLNFCFVNGRIKMAIQMKTIHEIVVVKWRR